MFIDTYIKYQSQLQLNSTPNQQLNLSTLMSLLLSFQILDKDQNLRMRVKTKILIMYSLFLQMKIIVWVFTQKLLVQIDRSRKLMLYLMIDLSYQLNQTQSLVLWFTFLIRSVKVSQIDMINSCQRSLGWNDLQSMILMFVPKVNDIGYCWFNNESQ